MRIIRRTLAVVTIALLTMLTACGTITNPAIGTWGTGENGDPQLKLTHEGVISGTDGCNSIKGAWQEDGDVITFYDFSTTEIACPGTTPWLVDPATATLDGDTLHILDSEGAELGSLTRQ